MKKTKTILLVGGGTGGHILPLKNLAENLLKKGVNVHLLTSNSDLDDKIVKQNFVGGLFDNKKKFIVHRFKAHKIHYHFSFENFGNAFKILGSFWTAKKLIKKINPKDIFFKGGFVGFPILMASQYLMRFKGKIYLHESDISTGALTQFFAKYAEKVFSNFGENPMPLFFFPVQIPSDLSVSSLNLKGNEKGNKKIKPKIFIFGGSQGAEFLNQIIEKNQKKLSEKYEVFLVTGLGKKIKNLEKNITQKELLSQDNFMEKLFESDLVIARSGASVFQVLAAHKKSILIPLPTSARNHQQKNADYFEAKKVCYILKQNKENIKELMPEIEKILKDKVLEKNIQKISVKDASFEISEILLKS